MTLKNKVYTINNRRLEPDRKMLKTKRNMWRNSYNLFIFYEMWAYKLCG